MYDASDGSDAGVLYASASVPVSKILRQVILFCFITIILDRYPV